MNEQPEIELYGNKKQLLENLDDLLSEGKKNIAIDGEWGIGKSFLIEQFKEITVNKCLVIDAWALSSLKTLDKMIKFSICEQYLDELETNELLKNIAVGYLKFIDDAFLKSKISSIIKAYENLPSNVEEIDDSNLNILMEIKNTFKIEYIFIDELDRSLPDISIELLKQIVMINKNSNSDYPQIITCTNLVAFESNIKHLYGESYNAHAFFDKTFDVILYVESSRLEKFRYLNNKLIGIGKGINEKSFSNRNVPSIFDKLTYRKLDLLIEDLLKFTFFVDPEYILIPLISILGIKYVHYSDFIELFNENISKATFEKLNLKYEINISNIEKIYQSAAGTDHNYYTRFISQIKNESK